MGRTRFLPVNPLAAVRSLAAGHRSADVKTATKLAALLLLVAACAAPAAATTYYIKPDGTGSFPNIQAGIDAALPGDIVELADGTFTGAGNRDIGFLGKAITVRSRSGNPETCIIDCQEAGRAFNFYDGEGPSSRLEGITITHGLQLSGSGGAIACGTAPTLAHLIFKDNEATSGGAIYT
jgi:predicted outer membrane repeat protein